MRQETNTINGPFSITRAIALCIGIGCVWLAFASPGSRPLNAEAEHQEPPSGRIRLGLPVPIFGEIEPPPKPVEVADTSPQTSWKTGAQTLQLVEIAEGSVAGNPDGAIDIRPIADRRSRPRRPFRPIAMQKEIAGPDQQASPKASGTDGREEWSIPGAFELSKLAQKQDEPGSSPSGVGTPRAFGEGVPAVDESATKVLDPVIPAPVVEQLPDEPKAGEVVDTPPVPLPDPVDVVPQLQLPQSPVPEPIIQPRQVPTVPRPQAAAPSPAPAPAPVTPPPVSTPPATPYINRQSPPIYMPLTDPVPSDVAPQVPEETKPPQPEQPAAPPIFVPPTNGYRNDVEMAIPPVTSQHSYDAPVPQQQPQVQRPIYPGTPPAAVPAIQVPQQLPLNLQTPMTNNQFGHEVYSPPIVSQPQSMPSPPTGVGGYSGYSSPPIQSFGHSMSGSFPGTSGFRATVESDAANWMAPYTSRAMSAAPATFQPVIPDIPEIPVGFVPWWNAAVESSVGTYANSHPVNVSSLLQDAMVHSPQVIAIKTEPEVQYRVIAQEAARFDWTAFLETTYDDLNDPVGSDLTTGNGEDRLLTRRVNGSAGFRRRNIEGGEFRIAQEVGHENQNSRFFVPNDQGSSRLELSYRQPVLDGAGQAYNESEIILAKIQANTSEDEVVDALQGHLTEVTEAYWTLYRARAEFFQRQKLLASAKNVLQRLDGRSKVDTIPRQILRAQAAVARAQTRIQRTLARVKDAEAQLRLLVNSPAMLNGGQTELMPTEPPRIISESEGIQTVLQKALVNRTDISEAIRKMRAAGVRLGVSRNELLPRLDFLVEAYVADLAGSSDVGRSLQGQFTDNRPGYTLGFEFELPIGNRAAVAKLEQRQWELKRSINIFRATVEKSLTDVEIANREVQTAYSEILSRFQSMKAADKESRYLKDRFEVLPAAEDSATLLLEDLLDSFERLADEESAFVQAQVDHAVALIKLKKEMGTLLRSRNSRPQLESAEESWMANRLDASSQVAEPLPQFAQESVPDSQFQNVSQGQMIPSVGHQGLSGSLPPSTGNVGQSSSGFNDVQRPRSVPIPKTPTSWRRPRASVYNGN